MLISTVVFLFFLFLVYALFLMASRKSDARQAKLQARVAEALRGLGPDNEIQISRDDSIGGSPIINRLLSSLDFVKRIEGMVRQADLQITVSRLLMFCLLAALMAWLAAATVMNSGAGVILALIAGVLPLLHVSRKRDKRLRAFNAQLPDTLDLLSRSLAVGHAFSESLHQVASEMPDPISTEFRITFEEQKLGLSVKAALDRLTERIPLPDLRLCVTAMQIQRETGGNLAEILEKVAATVRERFKLMEDFRTMTTASRGSAWILCALPFGIILIISVISPGYMSLALHDWRGHYMLATAGVLQLMGMLLIRKILNIRV
jgi:tight adherence protein B